MNHSLTFPKRAMMLSGVMRSGKTTALTHYLVGMSKHRQHALENVLLIIERPYTQSMLDALKELGADLTNIAIVPLNERRALPQAFPSPANLHTVVVAVDSVYQGEGVVKTYGKPSSSVQQYLAKLEDANAVFPHILYTAHLPNAVEHPAIG